MHAGIKWKQRRTLGAVAEQRQDGVAFVEERWCCSAPRIQRMARAAPCWPACAAGGASVWGATTRRIACVGMGGARAARARVSRPAGFGGYRAREMCLRALHRRLNGQHRRGASPAHSCIHDHQLTPLPHSLLRTSAVPSPPPTIATSAEAQPATDHSLCSRCSVQQVHLPGGAALSRSPLQPLHVRCSHVAKALQPSHGCTSHVRAARAFGTRRRCRPSAPAEQSDMNALSAQWRAVPLVRLLRSLVAARVRPRCGAGCVGEG